jgi:hypothetical protein
MDQIFCVGIVLLLVCLVHLSIGLPRTLTYFSFFLVFLMYSVSPTLTQLVIACVLFSCNSAENCHQWKMGSIYNRLYYTTPRCWSSSSSSSSDDLVIGRHAHTGSNQSPPGRFCEMDRNVVRTGRRKATGGGGYNIMAITQNGVSISFL